MQKPHSTWVVSSILLTTVYFLARNLFQLSAMFMAYVDNGGDSASDLSSADLMAFGEVACGISPGDIPMIDLTEFEYVPFYVP